MARCAPRLAAATVLLFCVATSAQTNSSTSAQDSQVVSALAQAFAVPGASVASAAQDSSGSGSIIYYWAGEQVKGTVSVRQRGTDQFRLDASLSAGTRSWSVSHGGG